MKTATIVGIILIVLGIFGFIFQGISYTTEEKIVDVGPIEVEAEKEETIPIPTVLSGLALAGGVALVIAGARKKA
jgi:hypothetical protein